MIVDFYCRFGNRVNGVGVPYHKDMELYEVNKS
jgi:hypothetical protein